MTTTMLERQSRPPQTLTTDSARVRDERPSLLALTSQLPWPLNSGGHIRTFHLMRALARRCDVRLVTTCVTSDARAGRQHLEEAGVRVKAVRHATPNHLVKFLGLANAAVRREPYVLYRRHNRRCVRALLGAELTALPPDVCYLDHLDSLVFGPLLPRRPVVMDLHNVYSKLLARVAEEQSRWLTRRYLVRESRLLQRMEERAARGLDALFAVSDEEVQFFRELGAGSVHLVPNGVDCEAYSNLPTGRTQMPPVILFLGSLSWEPNAQAAVFLAHHILPEVQRMIPEATLEIVGRNPEPRVCELASLPYVTVKANVPDVLPHLRHASVLAVPLDSGGGTRLKILEAFAAGLPVVSSPIGCEGIAARNGDHLSVVPLEGFADGLIRTLAEPQYASVLAERARRLAHDQYDWNSIGERAADAIEELLEQTRIRSDGGRREPALTSGRLPVCTERPQDVRLRSAGSRGLFRRQASVARPSTHASRPTVLHARVVTATGGGPEKTILDSPRYLKELDYDALCAFMHPPDDPGFEQLMRRAMAAEAGKVIQSVPDRGAWDLSVVGRLLCICREHNVAIWHGHDYKSNAIGLLLRRFWPMKLASTVHGWIPESRRMAAYCAIDRFCLKHYDRVICVCDALLDECLKAGVPSRNCLLIENAIDLDTFTRTRRTEQAKTALQLPAGIPVIGSVGRLSSEKGYDVLIRAMSHLGEAGIEAVVVIAGEGTERAGLERLIAELDLDSRVRLLGFQSDTRDLYEAMDVFVSTSWREGFPNVLLEAMAMNVPVVATGIAGTQSLIQDGQNGLLIDAGSDEQLATTLARLLHNPALRNQLADNGRKIVEREHSFAARMCKMAAVYDGLLDRADSERTTRRTSFGSQTHDGVDLAPESSSPATDPAAFRGQNIRPVALVTTSIVPEHHASGRVRVEPANDLQHWAEYLRQKGCTALRHDARWLDVLGRGLRHVPYRFQAVHHGRVAGVLPLALVASRLFGRYLVSLPYVNSAGVLADSNDAASALIDRAVQLADALDVRFLELRHERAIEHPQLTHQMTGKVHMRLALPDTVDELWNGLKSKVRSQVRKAMKNDEFQVRWGRDELLDDFYAIFCHNMRDLGTPPFSRELFAGILSVFSELSEICTVQLDDQPVAAALLVHGHGVTDVPSASSLRRFNATNANMLMYWHLLARSVERDQETFDFGRSSPGSGTFRFKKQWGAQPEPAVWQYYLRQGEISAMRPDSGKFDTMIRLWQHLPVPVTRWIGPSIVRGIP